jgi:tRNA modification GTPase
MSDRPTIFALSSGAGRAGVAVIRISGPGAPGVLVALAGQGFEPRKAALRTLRSPRTNDPIDEALVLHFRAPNSFTGEDVAELHVHGGRAVVTAVLDELAHLPGLRLAEAGEFTRRAFENGKLDLTEAEGLADLIAAETEEQRRQAFAGASGRQRQQLESWRTDLIRGLALVEAAIDFSDEADVTDRTLLEARLIAEGLATAIRHHLADGHRGEILRDGFRVVLAGAPNAGKSSLLNALARRDVAIVSPEPGTTRDAIEVRLDLAGLPVILTDTAGIRAAEGSVEREGIRRAYERASDAQLVLWLTDGSREGQEPPQVLGTPVVVRTKTDLAPPDPAEALPISALTGEGLDALTSFIAARACTALASSEPALVTRARHRQHLEACAAALDGFLAGSPVDLELRAEDLRQAASALGRLTGRVDVEDVLDEIFASFCIGK